MKRVTGIGGIFFKARNQYGRFGWMTDPEGDRIELWQPPRSP